MTAKLESMQILFSRQTKGPDEPHPNVTVCVVLKTEEIFIISQMRPRDATIQIKSF